jgi:hypothetical protein
MAVTAVPSSKTVADPNAAYESIVGLWKKNRAICGGERFVKELDAIIDTEYFSNILIPFSPSMNPKQYAFYKAEAELPGIVALYKRMILGALLRKKPQLELPEGLDSKIRDWIISEFGEDNSSLSAFLDIALDEELETSRCWIYVDYPQIPESKLANLTQEELINYKPYPVIWKAENVINWKVDRNKETGAAILTRVVIRTLEEKFLDSNEFHPHLVNVVKVHEIVEGKYQIRVYEEEIGTNSPVAVQGEVQKDFRRGKATVKLRETITNIQLAGKPLTIIPAWPLNGSIDVVDPILTPVVDKEIALYNKISRRNHLLYGAATYTPYITSNLTDEDFDEIVQGGLGTWLKLNQGDTVGVLPTPTEALKDMELAISAGYEEIAKLGVRMLSPETDQSGVALQLRNASQTAQLGTLNMKVSATMAAIIAFMINWRFHLELKATDIKFSLSADFSPAVLGPDWVRLATEWYQAGLISRNLWLEILKKNDVIEPEYDDEVGRQEINDDELITTQDMTRFNVEMTAAGAQAPAAPPEG